LNTAAATRTARAGGIASDGVAALLDCRAVFTSPFDRDSFDHRRPGRIGVLLSNLGTPEAPTAAALRPYLREFLSDSRVIELPRWKWLPILYLFVLTKRPKLSAELYRKVWTAEGSPLMTISRAQADGLQTRLRARFGDEVRVALGMRYGRPSIAAALAELAAEGCRRILVLPLYPQYSAATTGSTCDAVFAELARWRRVPGLRTVESYHDEPGYVRALAAGVRELWRRDGEPELLLMSFHGMPQRYFDSGDPYFCYCQKTARLVADELGLAPERWKVSFQSLFGKEEWLKPYTDKTVAALAAGGVRKLDVICPGFSADCLETLEEIDGLNREIFEHAGGERFRYVPCLNDHDDHLDFLAELATRHLAGWSDGLGEAERRARGVDAARRAAELRAAARA
jgi:protoporphyrin/coproporphyrin ferrochelatase